MVRIVRTSAVEPAVIPTFTESPLVIVSVCGVESENAPVCPEPIENVLLPLCLSLTVDVPVAAVLTLVLLIGLIEYQKWITVNWSGENGCVINGMLEVDI